MVLYNTDDWVTFEVRSIDEINCFDFSTLERR